MPGLELETDSARRLSLIPSLEQRTPGEDSTVSGVTTPGSDRDWEDVDDVSGLFSISKNSSTRTGLLSPR